MPVAKLPRRTAFYAGAHYDVGDSVGHRLFQLMTSMRREVDSRMVALGLTEAQWKPLWLLSTGRVDTAFELAREMGIDAGAVTRMLDRLAAKGLVERARSETDRRVVHLRLTPDGVAAAGRVPQVLADVNNDFLRGFTRAEFLQARDFLLRMLENGRQLQAHHDHPPAE